MDSLGTFELARQRWTQREIAEISGGGAAHGHALGVRGVTAAAPG